MPSSAARQAEPVASPLARLFLQEDLNFLVTNRLPRRTATKLMGWFSRIESRRLTRASLAVWKLFADDLRLDESPTTDFKSLHECFVRELKPGARPVHPDPDVLVSPCDAIVGAHGPVRGTEVFQAKGFPYSLDDLLQDQRLVERHRDGRFITLRLKSNMYHRFHAPCDARVRGVTYVSGDTWNVNPIALERVERLFCKNERAVIDLETPRFGGALTMVPVAAILVASMRFTFVDTPLTLEHRGARFFGCDASVSKGDELGRFEAGSTIILFASGDFEFAPDLRTGDVVRVGEPLLRFTQKSPHPGESR
ncbi:MAG: archaetidylserine decarboxylase [Myxococcaceae bacterium]|nr:archaetidylserine decarboxylase [Myxococcaceae bacterium]